MSDPVAWTFATGGDVVEQLEFLTDALPADTGPAQTRRLRQWPRTLLRFDGQESGDGRRWLETVLWHNGAGQWKVPLVMDARPLLAAVALGAGSLAVDTSGARFEPGGQALLQGADARTFELVDVEAVEDGELVLSDETLRAWPSGTRVSPLRLGWLPALPSMGRFTSDDSAVYQAQFQLIDVLEQVAAYDGPVYRAYPVIEIRPVWVSDPSWVPERELVVIDEATTAPTVFDLVGQARDRVALQFALEGVAAIASFRKLLYALAGRWSPAWVPTWAQDLRVVADVADDATTMDVRGPGLSAYPLANSRRDLRIELADGRVLYRRVTAAAAHTLSVDRLTLDVAIDDGFAVGDVVLVSFMALSRQDSDVNALRYFNWETVQCELTFRGEVHAL